MARDPVTSTQIERVKEAIDQRRVRLQENLPHLLGQSQEVIEDKMTSHDLDIPRDLEISPISELEEDHQGLELEAEEKAAVDPEDKHTGTGVGEILDSTGSSTIGSGGGPRTIESGGKRNFALREARGEETSVFSGNTPRQAALKAARRLTEAGNSEESAPRTEIRLREKGTDKVHIYDAWAWETTAPSDKPDWMPREITEANVSKKGIEHLDE